MSFHGQSWVLIGDTEICPFTKQQINICKELKVEIKGAILCNESENQKSEACKNVASFPSFCNIETKVCIPGLKETLGDFQEIQKLSNDLKY